MFSSQRTTTNDQEMHMNTLSSKLSAFAAAIVMNGAIMAGVVYLFALQAQPHVAAFGLV